MPYVTSVIAIGIVWRWIFNEHYGLLNQILSWFGIKAIPWLNKKQYALPALIIFSIWKSMAFDILIFLAGLQTISPDLYNAAKVDSTPKWRVFTKITLPGIMPMVSYALVMGMINAFKVYNEVYSLVRQTVRLPLFTICMISFTISMNTVKHLHQQLFYLELS